MKNPFIIIGFIILAGIIAYAALGSQSDNTSQNESTNLNWHTDLDSALVEAKQTNKPVFIDFYTTWCAYCKQLDETTLSDPRVQEKLSKNYVVAKIDADKYPDIASNYKIYGYPTLLVLDSNGVEIKRIEGYVDSNTLLNQL
ncbi:thioredoxin family protein [Methanobacterium oryzae]|uniref:thioredoxin family protein n=1 Tax=Methanobacterium oryzae TaxID=69540 RepID=UPI003D1FFAB4